MKPPAIPPDASPAALARAIAILRAEGDHAAADFLQSHLPPAHGPLPHWDDSQMQPNAGQQLPPPNGDEGAGEGPFPDAGGLTESGVPGAPNAHSAGSLPPKIDKAYEWTRNPLAPSFPLTDTTAPDKPADEPEHKFGCVLLPIPEPARGRVLALGKMIPTADLAPDGRENDIHATVLFGIHDSVAHADVFEILSHFRPVRLRLGAVTVFENGEHDVIKIEVESDQIRRMNNALRHLPHTSKWSEYRPHVTVAYVQPGLGAQYARQFGTLDAKCRCQSAVYSTSDGDKHVYPLGRLIRVEKAATSVHSTIDKAAMSYLNAGTGGALVGPPTASRRKRIKLKRNRSALAQLCRKALEEVGSGFANSSSLTKQLSPDDPEEFIFGTKAFDPAQPRDKAGRWAVVESHELADDPGADKRAVAHLATAAPPAARDHIESAHFNMLEEDDDVSPEARRLDTVHQLGAAWRRAHDSGHALVAHHVAAALASFGAAFHGPDVGERISFSNRHYDAPAGIGPGDSVTVAARPLVLGDRVIVKGSAK